MLENNTLDVIAYSPGGVSAPGVADSPAVMFQKTGGEWNVYAGPTCGGPWGAKPVITGQRTPVASPDTVSDPLQLCIAGGNTTVDGTLTALYNSNGQARTVNTLPLEDYVADTVPGESPSSWATLGGPGPQGQDWGFQELEAQAIAVRSYALSDLDGYGGYADTCDLGCQNYRGTEYVTPESIAAANDTALEVMYMPDGNIATTEYSSSTGGYTASATEGSPFAPVVDAGDAVSENTHHDWTATVTRATISAHWPEIGTLTGIEVTSSNHLGTSIGRLDTLELKGTKGTMPVTAAAFVAATASTGVQSDWFSITPVSDGSATLHGHGWGPGIGMGQWGALGYAIGTDAGEGNWTYQQILDHYYQPATIGNLSGPAASVGASGGIGGYWLSAADGGIFSFGDAHFYGSMGGKPLNKPVVGMAATPDGGGYWEVASDGGIFSFGDAHFYGSMGGTAGGDGTAAILATANGQGYLLVTSGGMVTAFGDAPLLGDLTTVLSNYDGTVVGVAPVPS